MKKLLIFFITLLSLNNISAQKYIQTYIKDANKVGTKWWGEVNSGEYENSYNKLSDILKSRFTLEEWTNQISTLMNEFGNIKTRDVKNTYFQSKLEGFEDGFYVTIEYSVKYSKTRNHSENLLLKQSDQLDSDGKFEWRIFDFDYTFQSLENTE